MSNVKMQSTNAYIKNPYVIIVIVISCAFCYCKTLDFAAKGGRDLKIEYKGLVVSSSFPAKETTAVATEAVR